MMKERLAKLKPGQIPPYHVSGGEFLAYTAEPSDSCKPYTYSIEGMCYGRKWLCCMTKEGARELAMKILESL